jgi:hypothetical protein
VAATDQQVRYSFPIFKFEKNVDGDLVVYGKCTDGTVDADHQIVDPKWSGKALADWLGSGGNMRVQHSPFLYPAGKGLALDIDKDGDGGHYLKALVVKDTPAFGLVEKRVLKDFSIGILDPRIVHDSPLAPGGRIVGGKIGEVSLVDRGSNKNTTFEIAKSVGDGIELVAKMSYISPMAQMALTKKKKKPKIVDSGGQDRSDVPAGDFAGPGHTFPIERPDDVPDAASLAHHADNPEQVRGRIRSIARRKFGEDTPMPPSLQDGKAADPDLTKSDSCPTCQGKGKIRDGNMACPDCDGPDDADKGLAPDVTKGDAGEDYPGDVTDDDDDEYDTDDTAPASADAQRTAKKSFKRAIRRQKRILKSAAQRGNNGGDTPAGVRGHQSPDAQESGYGTAKDKEMVPAGRHREPDGAQAEGLEADAGMDSSHESGDKTGVPGSKWGKKARKKGKRGIANVPGSDWDVTKSVPSAAMRQLHDALCPGFKWGQVRKGYGLSRSVGAAIPVQELESVAMNAIVKGNLSEAAYFTSMLELAADIQHIGPELLLDARKALPSMVPTAHPHQQDEVRPSQFQRDYLSDGRPSLTADSSSGRSSIPSAQVHTVSAQDFRRGYLSAGRADESPNSGKQPTAGTQRFGYALSTIGEMHSKVTALWPGMCPVNVTQRDYTTAEGNTGIKPSSMSPAPAQVPGSSFTKGTEVELRKSHAAALARIAELEEENAVLGALPDPEQAPYRGLPQLDGPVDRESFVGKALGSSGAPAEAEDEDAEFLEFINGIAASGDPRVRLNATKAIRTLLTK